MTITWLGHSCFILESGGFRAILDPYRGIPGLPDVSAEAGAVYCSHSHDDHCYTEHITLTAGLSNPFTVEEVEVFHDDAGGAKRGKNTARRFTAEGVSVVHLGDLGHALSESQIRALTPCDVLLIPVGGFFTIDAKTAKQVADSLAARVVVPMHYRQKGVGYPVIGTVDKFTGLYPAEQVRKYAGNVLTVQRDMPGQVAVLALP